MERRHHLRFGLAIVALTLLVTLAVVYTTIKRSSRSDTVTLDFDSLGTTLKAGLSGVAVVRRNTADNPLTMASSGLLVGCEKYPEKCRDAARLLDTWRNAVNLSQAVFEHASPGDWVASSRDLQLASEKADAWGHNFCVLRRGEMLLVLSAGPKSTGSPVCRNIRVTAAELAQIPKGRLLETPAGYFILVATASKS